MNDYYVLSNRMKRGDVIHITLDKGYGDKGLFGGVFMGGMLF